MPLATAERVLPSRRTDFARIAYRKGKRNPWVSPGIPLFLLSDGMLPGQSGRPYLTTGSLFWSAWGISDGHAVLPWRTVKPCLKDPVEGCLALKASLVCDLCDGSMCVPQHCRHVGEADLIEVMIEVLVERAGKDPGELIGADAKIPCHTGQGDVLLKVCSNVGDSAVDRILILLICPVGKGELWKCLGKQDLDEGVEKNSARGVLRIWIFICQCKQSGEGIGHVRGNILSGDDGVCRALCGEDV